MEITNLRVKEWLSVKAESPKTKQSYSEGWVIFENYCRERGKDVCMLVEDYRAIRYKGEIERELFLEDWQDTLRGYYPYLKTLTNGKTLPKYASQTIKQLLAIAKSYVGYWKLPLNIDLPKHSYVTYHNRDIRKEEIRNILTFASPRDRVIYLLMVESGLRVGTAVNLKYWQIKEDFEAKRTPMKILLPSSELKDHVGDRWTFIGSDGFKELSRYLAKRLPLKDDNFVFASEKEGLVKGEQFTSASLSTKFNRIVQKLDICASNNGKPKKIRLHGLRKYFRNNMKADSAFVEFWMGHSLGVDAHYISRDPEEHRKRYSEGYNYLKIYEGNVEDLNQFQQELQKKDREIKDLREELRTIKEGIDKVISMDLYKEVVEDIVDKLAEKLISQDPSRKAEFQEMKNKLKSGLVIKKKESKDS